MSPGPNAEGLEQVFESIWKLVERGVADRRSPFHTPTIITHPLPDPAATAPPSARTVILRACDPRTCTLEVHTDARSRKVIEMGQNPQLSVHIYDPGNRIQVVMSGQATLHRYDTGNGPDEVARIAWTRTPGSARQLYRQRLAPGQPIAAPAQAWESAGQGDKNFVAIRIGISGIAWLELGRSQHRRAHFLLGESGWRHCWLAP
jgi:hypothetical protein